MRYLILNLAVFLVTTLVTHESLAVNCQNFSKRIGRVGGIEKSLAQLEDQYSFLQLRMDLTIEEEWIAEHVEVIEKESVTTKDGHDQEVEVTRFELNPGAKKRVNSYQRERFSELLGANRRLFQEGDLSQHYRKLISVRKQLFDLLKALPTYRSKKGASGEVIEYGTEMSERIWEFLILSDSLRGHIECLSSAKLASQISKINDNEIAQKEVSVTFNMDKSDRVAESIFGPLTIPSEAAKTYASSAEVATDQASECDPSVTSCP